MVDEPLFGPGFARRLEKLKWILRRRLASGGEGDRAGRRKGGLIEFSDHRAYAPGDDLRTVDWHVYFRLDTLVVKEFAKEEEVPLGLLLDASASMAGGKFRLACRACAALAYISLASRNPVTLTAFRRGERKVSRPLVGESAIFELTRMMEALAPEGETDIAGALAQARARGPARRLHVLVSDLLDPQPFETPLSALPLCGAEACVLQILAPEETAPRAVGPVTLVDAETGETLNLDLEDEDLDAYGIQLNEREERFRRFATSRGIRFTAVRADASLEDVVLNVLREANWFRLAK